jgi:coenzyme PQQ precursor peptide PqqA
MPAVAHEILDPTIMIVPFRTSIADAEYRGDGNERTSIMKWETPEAIDFRFGMEITMYVANR